MLSELRAVFLFAHRINLKIDSRFFADTDLRFDPMRKSEVGLG
jgi:hypothetical protein